MQKFIYQIKSFSNATHEWRDVYKGIIEATDKKEAKKKLNELFDCELKEKVSSGKEKPEFRLLIFPLDEEWEKYWLGQKTCETCSSQYIIIDSHQKGEDPSARHCSAHCRRAFIKTFVPEHLEPGFNNAKATIYKITNKNTGMCYIGSTTQPFTLRWWQHFSQLSDCKFHKAIKDSLVSDWVFEVLEVLENKSTNKLIFEREQFYIEKYKSIENGYNTSVALKTT